MLCLTIVKEKGTGCRIADRWQPSRYHFRVGKTAQDGGDVEVIEVLNQKEGESRAELEKRADDFLADYALKFG